MAQNVILHVFYYSFILHYLGKRTRPISIPYGGCHWWDLNLHTPTCESLLYHCVMDADMLHVCSLERLRLSMKVNSTISMYICEVSMRA